MHEAPVDIFGNADCQSIHGDEVARHLVRSHVKESVVSRPSGSATLSRLQCTSYVVEAGSRTSTRTSFAGGMGWVVVVLGRDETGQQGLVTISSAIKATEVSSHKGRQTV